MPDGVILERLQLILEHAAVIKDRVDQISEVEAFLNTKEGQLITDSIMIRLQALTENIKKIERLDPFFFKESILLDVKPIIRFRDLASHHYEALDPELVLSICRTKLPPLVSIIQSYLESLKS